MNKIKTYLSGKNIFTNESEAFSMYKKSWFGEVDGEKINYSIPEAMYLLNKGKIDIIYQNKKLSKSDCILKFSKQDKKIQLKYSVYKNLRDNGYIPKTGLKFGADFRVYEKGSRDKKKHAKWLVIAESESKKIALHEFSAKNRVAHSTRKKLLLAIVDDENKVTYFEVSWIKP